MKYFIAIIFVFFCLFSQAQHSKKHPDFSQVGNVMSDSENDTIPIVTTSPIDTNKVVDSVKSIAIAVNDTIVNDTIVKDTIVKQSEIIQIVNDSISVAVVDSVRITDTLAVVPLDSVQIQKDTTVIAPVFSNPENLAVSNTVTGDYIIADTKHTDITIENSIISNLVIEDVESKYLTISSGTMAKITIRNSQIGDILIEDSSIGEIVIENSKITEFETDDSSIKKQTILSGKAKPPVIEETPEDSTTEKVGE
jgi:hypothetical protein